MTETNDVPEAPAKREGRRINHPDVVAIADVLSVLDALEDPQADRVLACVCLLRGASFTPGALSEIFDANQ